MFKLKKTAAAKEQYAKREKPVSHFIPYKGHWDKNTILTKNNGLLQVIKVGGFSFETADDSDLDIRKNIRNSLLKNMASGNVTLYFHTIRRRKAVMQRNSEYSIDPTVKTSKDFISYLEGEWQAKNSSSDSYFNELYVSILYEPDKQGAAVIEYLFTKIRQKSNKAAWENDMREMHESMQEMTTRVVNTLRDYDTELLGVKKTRDGIFCEISEFLGTIINCGDSSRHRQVNGLWA
jgi:type IV secretion system protein VirB4